MSPLWSRILALVLAEHPASARPYGSILRRWLALHPDPAAASALDVREFLAAPSARSGREGQPVTASGRQTRLTALRALYRTGLECRALDLDPTDGIRVRPCRAAPRYLSADDVRRLLEATAAAPPRRALRDRAVLLLALLTGLRARELAGLRARDLDRSAGEAWLATVRLKGGRVARVAIPPPAARAIEAYHLARGARLEGLEPDALVLGLRRDGYRSLVRRYARRLGLAMGTHTLRHTCARGLLSAGVPLGRIRDRLGHLRTSTTDTYLRTLAPEHDPRDAEALLAAWGIEA